MKEIEETLLSLGRLDGTIKALGQSDTFPLLLREEAVIASGLDGIRSGLLDLLLCEVDEETERQPEDVMDVFLYTLAHEHGLARIRRGEAFTWGLVRDMHGILCTRAPGGVARPRRRDDFLAARTGGMDPLSAAAAVHAWLETAHPFPDGNLRTALLVSSLMLVSRGVLSEPLFYFSHYVNDHHAEYRRLLKARDTEAWLVFYLRGVRAAAAHMASALIVMAATTSADDGSLLLLGRRAASARRVLACLMAQPLDTIDGLAAKTGLSEPAVMRALAALQAAGMVQEVTGRPQRCSWASARLQSRAWAYTRLLGLLDTGGEALRELCARPLREENPARSA